MQIPEYIPGENEILTQERYNKLIGQAVNTGLSSELKANIAGFQLARLVATQTQNKANEKITFGVENSFNGSIGLAAAIRMKGWAYNVEVLLLDEKGTPSFTINLTRAKSLSIAINENIKQTDVFVDCFFNFDLQNNNDKINIIKNKLPEYKKIISYFASLNIWHQDYPISGTIVTPACAKRELVQYLDSSEIFIIDIGIPWQIYYEADFSSPLEFDKEGILVWKKESSN